MRKLGESVESAAPPVRRREVTWQDPLVSAALARDLSGLDYLLGIAEGRFPPPPIAALLGMSILSVAPGQVTFGLDVGEHLYNPIGSVHGGVFCTLLDSAMGCSVHASLDRGQAYTTLELKVNIVKALTLNTPSVTATGQVISAGRRVATASGQITGPDGTLYAHATTTCLVFEPRPSARRKTLPAAQGRTAMDADARTTTRPRARPWKPDPSKKLALSYAPRASSSTRSPPAGSPATCSSARSTTRRGASCTAASTRPRSRAPRASGRAVPSAIKARSRWG